MSVPWRRKFCSSTTSTSRPRACSATRSPNAATTSRHSRWCPPSGSTTPAGDVTFPDPTGYDVIVPLGARWPVYDDALRQTWVGAEMQMVRDAADAGVPMLGVCFGGQLLAQAFGGSVARSATPEIGWYDVDERRREPDARRAVVPVAFRPLDAAAGRHRNRPHRRLRRRRSCSAGRSRCSSTRSSTTTCWSGGWPKTATARSSASGRSHDELRSATTELAESAARRIRGLVRGFLSGVARQPCPS